MSTRPIQALSKQIVHRIAAGEVVDRPASVLKELVENSIDAGAKKIKVTVVNGGLKQLEIIDDGVGMTKQDLQICTQRHATSKISHLDDLDNVHSLGFRGEALAAISSVSCLSIETKRDDEAWLLTQKGSEDPEIVPGNIKVGTKLSVDNLFFNTPARLKFLKRPATESRQCRDLLEELAIANPNVHLEWYFVNEQGELKESAFFEATTWQNRFIETLAEQVDFRSDPVDSIVAIDEEHPIEGVSNIKIAILRPPLASRTQKNIYLVVNGRTIKDKRLPYSLREAFAGFIEVGQFPYAYVSLTVDPKLIDVNIHPQKKEIRWPSDFSLARIAYNFVRPHFELTKTFQAQTQNMDLWKDGRSTSPSPQASVGVDQISYVNSEDYVTFDNVTQDAVSQFEKTSSTKISKPEFKFSSLKVVGEVGAAWLVCEDESGMVMLDQHAAHERVNYERILATSNLLRSKPLLFPVEIKLNSFTQGYQCEIYETLKPIGFDFNEELPDEAAKIEIIALPESDRKIKWHDILQSCLDDLSTEAMTKDWQVELKSKIAASLACHGSLRRGKRITNDEIVSLLKQLDELQWGHLCPHGRPVWVSITHEHLEKLFHRV